MENLQVPESNIQVYSYIYNIENGLRELIIDSLEAVFGKRWYKIRLPGDVLEKYRNGVNAERKTRWFEMVPSHPIYYVDFSDIRKIIEREDNWRDAFYSIFLNKGDIVQMLTQLEHVRNNVAHNRKVSRANSDFTKMTYEKLSNLIGTEYFMKLYMRCTCSDGIYDMLSALRKECEETFYICTNYKKLEGTKVWTNTRDTWWFDETYLDCKLDWIINYFICIEKYGSLPRLRGAGYRIESWVKNNNIENLYSQAQDQFANILGRATENNE